MSIKEKLYTGWASKGLGLWHYFEDGKALCGRVSYEDGFRGEALGWDTVDFKCKICWKKERLERDERDKGA